MLDEAAPGAGYRLIGQNPAMGPRPLRRRSRTASRPEPAAIPAPASTLQAEPSRPAATASREVS